MYRLSSKRNKKLNLESLGLKVRQLNIEQIDLTVARQLYGELSELWKQVRIKFYSARGSVDSRNKREWNLRAEEEIIVGLILLLNEKLVDLLNQVKRINSRQIVTQKLKIKV